jgi:tetratricopeptide (TPR) repeat protein
MRRVFLLFWIFTLLLSASFQKFYSKGNRSYELGDFDNAYLNYTKAYNSAKSKREKISSLGALVQVSKELRNYTSAKEYANKILEIDPLNSYAKKVLNSLNSNTSRRLTKDDVLKLICRKPHKNSCRCEDFKFADFSEFASTESMDIKQIIKGNFIHKDEAIVTLIGCEPHSDDWGGYLLLKRDGRRFEVVKYNTPYLGECQRVKFKRKDALLCKSEYSNQGYFVDSIFLNYFDKYLKLKSRLIYQGKENGGAVGEDSKEYKNTTIKSWRLIRENGSLYVVLRVYDEDFRHKNRLKTIKKKID